ncbi:MAG: hypothetical protein K0S93_862 [Nitrososphaeraceae archaeon]|jgi:hypothetical protein|nr:hypothetical protein [Nitrososphaeraceae archaeon]
MLNKTLNQPTVKKPPITPSKPKSPLERGGRKY